MRKGFSLFIIIGAMGLLCVDLSYQKYQNGYVEGQTQFIGRPMNMANLPKGEYSVEAIVGGRENVAVVQKDFNVLTAEPKIYILVSGMTPSMMEQGYVFSVGAIQ